MPCHHIIQQMSKILMAEESPRPKTKQALEETLQKCLGKQAIQTHIFRSKHQRDKLPQYSQNLWFKTSFIINTFFRRAASESKKEIKTLNRATELSKWSQESKMYLKLAKS